MGVRLERPSTAALGAHPLDPALALQLSVYRRALFVVSTRSTALMRAVFVRRRAETKITPAWMGGLNYEDKALPKLPWNIDKRALSSDFASALQTRVHSDMSDIQEVHTHRTAIQSRPNTSGRVRLQSARPASSGRQPWTAQEQRPQSACPPGSSSHWRSPQLPLDPKQLDARLRESSIKSTYRPATGTGSLTSRIPRTSSSHHSSENCKKAPVHKYYTLHCNVLGVGGTSSASDVDSEAGFSNACVALAIDGTSDGAGQTHMSKPFKFSPMAFLPLPENWIEFALTGKVHSMLMSVKVYRKTSDSAKSGEAGVQRKF